MQHTGAMSDPIETAIFEKLSRIDPKGDNGKSIEPSDVAKVSQDGLVIGIVGSYIGAFLANALGIQLGEIFSGWFWGNLIVAAIGAVVLIWALRLVRGR